jgi:2',3'-cyclic-nucleotide 2'-phosphodiesterase/3'-nucleotidase
MNRKIFIFMLLLSAGISAQDKQTLVLLHTTDVHGNVIPYDYFNDKPDNNGLAKIYTRVKYYRSKFKDVILLDGGDLIQGTPMVYYFDHIDYSVPNPMSLVMNYMRYDAFTVGNHDIEQGYLTYVRVRTESDFPWLAGNCLYPDSSTFFKPYTIIERDGIRTGIIGLTTPAIPMWLDSTLYPGLHWQDMITAARRWVAIVRPQVDVLVGVFHAGMNADYSREQTDRLGLPNENASRLVAEQVPGFDVIFCGHSHKIYPYKSDDPAYINNTLVVMSGSHARYLGGIMLDLDRDSDRWHIVHGKSFLEKTDTVATAPEILAVTDMYHKKTLTYIRQVIGEAQDSISGKLSRLQDNSLVELINRAQMYATGASISFAASFNDRFLLPPGPVRIKDVYGMYRYENFLYTVKLTGREIKDYLEYSSRYLSWDPQNHHVAESNEIPGYNYDMAEGIGYEVHVAEPAGSRIKNLTDLSTGKALAMDSVYTVALNSYRASGGGGHLAAAGLTHPVITWKSSEEMRNLLTDYIEHQKILTDKVDHNWKIVPPQN